ncbi:hypothetical protein KCP77_18700 [Salmonella enterica subsp. enterica]|nr:hypothetical protein KCP77_18700 [Salmonella enterica subsp. enterica]
MATSDIRTVLDVLRRTHRKKMRLLRKEKRQYTLVNGDHTAYVPMTL